MSRPGLVAEDSAAMTTSIIVSYDGTTHDDDALALGRQLASAGAALSLAYVRHTHEYDPRREEIGAYDANRRLEQGAVWLGEPDITRHVVFDPSTSAGLARLAEDEGAQLVLFGSDYRTPPGHVEPGGSAQGMLEGSAVAVGVAQAGLRTHAADPIRTILVSGDSGDAAARTAESLAAALGAEIVSGRSEADLILVDSQPNAPQGRIALGGATRARLDSARGSVIVLPRGTALSF
jgi:Universal stress protein family